MFDNQPTPVRLFTIKEIPTPPSLPKLGEIVRAFKEKGYNLADLNLHETPEKRFGCDSVSQQGTIFKQIKCSLWRKLGIPR